MEKKFTTLSELKGLSPKEGSTTQVQVGEKTFREKIQANMDWIDRKKKEGWEQTPDGLLPLSEIKKAGYIYNDDGGWTIPAESYMADGTSPSRRAGDKYIGPSQQYLRWRKEFFRPKEYVATPPRQLFKKEEVTVPTANDEIDVSKIPF